MPRASGDTWSPERPSSRYESKDRAWPGLFDVIVLTAAPLIEMSLSAESTLSQGAFRSHADWDEWNVLLKTAGIRRVRVHDARHTAATLLLAQGVDQRVVMEILGHSQISMTSRYAHVLPQVMTDAAERIGRALRGET